MLQEVRNVKVMSDVSSLFINVNPYMSFPHINSKGDCWSADGSASVDLQSLLRYSSNVWEHEVQLRRGEKKEQEKNI